MKTKKIILAGLFWPMGLASVFSQSTNADATVKQAAENNRVAVDAPNIRTSKQNKSIASNRNEAKTVVSAPNMNISAADSSRIKGRTNATENSSPITNNYTTIAPNIAIRQRTATQQQATPQPTGTIKNSVQDDKK